MSQRGGPELELPDRYQADCDNCQGLCCVAHRHEAGKFPIIQDKPAGVACINLETSDDGEVQKYRCQIYDKLESTGWRVCTGYGCLGAGQMVSKFFRELGVEWDTENLNEVSVVNLRYAFQTMRQVFKMIEFVRKTRINGDRAAQDCQIAIKPVVEEFGEQLEKLSEEFDPNYWFHQRFKPAIIQAVESGGYMPKTY